MYWDHVSSPIFSSFVPTIVLVRMGIYKMLSTKYRASFALAFPVFSYKIPKDLARYVRLSSFSLTKALMLINTALAAETGIRLFGRSNLRWDFENFHSWLRDSAPEVTL